MITVKLSSAGSHPASLHPFLSCSAPEPLGNSYQRFLGEEAQPVVHTGQTLLSSLSEMSTGSRGPCLSMLGRGQGVLRG